MRKNNQRDIQSLYIGQEQTFWVSALGLSHISPTSLAYPLSPNECPRNGDCLALFYGVLWGQVSVAHLHSVRGNCITRRPLGV